jgi:hypothetical protein
MSEKAVIYDAAGEYAKIQRSQTGPRNVPAHIMAQTRGAAINQLIGNPATQAAMSPGFSGDIAKWNTFTREQKLDKIADTDNPETIKAAMIMEEDNDMLQILLDQKIALEKEASK